MYKHFRYARRVDANNIALYHNNMTKLLQLDKGTANIIKVYGGLGASGDDLAFYPNTTDVYPRFTMYGNSSFRFQVGSGEEIEFFNGTTQQAVIQNNCLFLLETTTPTAKADYGALYTKNDNKVYFQDGAGVEHEIAFA